MATMMADRVSVMGYAAKARWTTVRIETEDATYIGKVFVPETKKRLSEVLCDNRPFLSLTDVTINHGKWVEPFVALNKRFVKTVRVLSDGESAVVPLRGRD